MTPKIHAESFSWQPSETGPHGSQLILLTVGNIPVLGQLNRNGHFVSWAKLPSKAEFKSSRVERPPGGSLLILNPGGSIIISAWRDDCKFLAWHVLPSRVRNNNALEKNDISPA